MVSSATPWRKRSTTYATARASSACAMWPLCQEGYDPVCEQAFREIAHLTHGAYCRFTPGAPHVGELLRAAAAYAAGGMIKCYGSEVERAHCGYMLHIK